jgi:hypothetical protein
MNTAHLTNRKPPSIADAAMPAVMAAINSVSDVVQRRARDKPFVTSLAEASEVDDMLHNTDLRIQFAVDLPIACRVREFQYLEKYGNEFTIRARARNGGRTEISKVVAGEGTFIFYGFIGEAGPQSLARWFIGDLDVWRSWRLRMMRHERPTYRHQKFNYDGSAFNVYNRRDLPSDFIIAEWDWRHGMKIEQETLF